MEHLFDEMSNSLADQDYFLPPSSAGVDSRRYRPSRSLSGWTSATHGVWLGWTPFQAATLPLSGWKVHISSTYEHADETLDLVAEICEGLSVPFKHLASEFHFVWLHHKYAHRAQSGKFITAYPSDIDSSHEFMELASAALEGKEGPFILTDRRFKDSNVVHYRYGAYHEITSFDKTSGLKRHMVSDANGTLVEDQRAARFSLPAGMNDPFENLRKTSSAVSLPSAFQRYRVDSAIRHSNGGGTYAATDLDTGAKVFIKEARSYTGLTWDLDTAQQRLRREWETLNHIDRVDSGLCPRPIDYFSEWEHDFLVTEWIDGQTLHRWVMDNMPLVRYRPEAEETRSYFERCIELLAQLEVLIQRVEKSGYRFGDLNPKNVIISANGEIRLVDYEAATRVGEPPAGLATPGYYPPHRKDCQIDADIDEFAISAIARCMIFPVHELMHRNPRFWSAAGRDAERVVKIPGRLWTHARRFSSISTLQTGEAAASRPEPESSDSGSTRVRSWLEGLARGISQSARIDGEHWAFPPSHQGLSSNTTCFLYGTAGILSTFHLTRRLVPDEWIRRLMRDIELQRHRYDDSLYLGSAGIAATLAGLGLVDESIGILPESDSDHDRPGSLAVGLVGRAVVFLDLYCRTGERRWLSRATAIARAIVNSVHQGDDILYDNERVGLMHGHSGAALLLHIMAAVTNDQSYLRAGSSLLHRDLAAAMTLEDGTLSVPDRVGGRRAMPYLGEGSSGVGVVASLYTNGSDELARRIFGLSRDACKLFTLNTGLYSGLGGLVYFHAEVQERSGDSDSWSVYMVDALEKYLIESDRGYTVLADGGTQYSSDVWSGAAGVMRTLDALLRGPRHQYLPLLDGGVLDVWLENRPLNEGR